MSIVRLYTTGSGVTDGMHGAVLGIGDIGPAGGTATLVGRTIGTGITATLSIITIVVVRSITLPSYAPDIMSCAAVYRVESMQLLTLNIRSLVGTPV